MIEEKDRILFPIDENLVLYEEVVRIVRIQFVIVLEDVEIECSSHWSDGDQDDVLDLLTNVEIDEVLSFDLRLVLIDGLVVSMFQDVEKVLCKSLHLFSIVEIHRSNL